MSVQLTLEMFQAARVLTNKNVSLVNTESAPPKPRSISRCWIGKIGLSAGEGILPFLLFDEVTLLTRSYFWSLMINLRATQPSKPLTSRW